jgi:hypothetical protein
MSPESTPHRARPSWARGSRRRRTSSAAGTAPRPGHRAGLVLGIIEAGAGVAFQLREDLAPQQSRGHVDLHVELPQLGLEAGVGDRLKGSGVDQRRIPGVVGEVELYLEPKRSALRVKPGLREHAGKHVQACPDLAAVALTVLSGERVGGNLLTHVGSIRQPVGADNRWGLSIPRAFCSGSEEGNLSKTAAGAT